MTPLLDTIYTITSFSVKIDKHLKTNSLKRAVIFFFFLTLFNRKIDYSAIGHSNTTATTSAFTEVDVKDVTRYAKTPNAAGILGT